MAVEEEAQRDWHRLFGLVLTDFFAGSPFAVDVERDLSTQQQLLDVIIIRRGKGRMAVRLPDGLAELAGHNLVSFKSHREALDGWAMKDLLGRYVAYRKLASPATGALLAEDRFRLYAVCARFPHNLSSQVPWQERQPGVYDCRWGTDSVRVVVAGQLPRQPHNAPLHLCSAPRHSWSPSPAPPTGGARKPRACYWASCSRRFKGRASPCHSPWRTSSASSSRSTSPS
jgi:hypothetical protein